MENAKAGTPEGGWERAKARKDLEEEVALAANPSLSPFRSREVPSGYLSSRDAPVSRRPGHDAARARASVGTAARLPVDRARQPLGRLDGAGGARAVRHDHL